MRILDWLFGPQNSNVSVYAIQPESTSYQPANQEGETERGVASSLSSTYPMGGRSDDESSQTDAIAIVQLSRPGIHERLDSERPSEKLLDVVQSMKKCAHDGYESGPSHKKSRAGHWRRCQATTVNKRKGDCSYERKSSEAQYRGHRCRNQHRCRRCQ